ncbi:EAL domain-containing protein [Vibrio sp. ZSDE26]|uniref:cyclic-guanylate-specific phosphodiesterase n=1 Tax=Vibrio amylolyticus TaxID=2847292 RepID=A0A9X2BFG1_9VIBR|nr:EAL domain-containing protein [Vibrio amylolyticus]MCK6261709.1 EAL domain-containing protein [Vibrio amylolyticus]
MKSDSLVKSLTVTVIISFATLSLVWLSFLNEKEKSAVQAQKLLANVQIIVDELNRSFGKLNALEPAECDDSLLVAMRKSVFDSKFIRDIGYLEGHDLLCTTGLGRLDTPFFDNRPPDFKSGFGLEYWSSVKLVLFDQAYDGIVVRRNKFNAVLNPKDINDIIPINYNWEIVLRVEDSYKVLESSDGASGHIHDQFELHNWQSTLAKECSNDKEICVLASSKSKVNLFGSPLYLFLFSIIAGQLSFLAIKGVNYYYRRKSSNKYRVAKGLDNKAFSCAYQTIVGMKSEDIVGVELLARFEDSIGILTPDVFIPEIQNQGRSWEFTEFLVTQAVQELKDKFGEAALPKSFKLNINAYPCDISAGKMSVLQWKRALNINYVVEVIESEALEDVPAAQTIQNLKAEGALIAIDDFGTGYSNLSSLKQIQADILKIDKSFVKDLDEGAIRSALIPQIIEIARSEHLKIVAEGVETQEQHKKLAAMGVDFGQGWYYSKPVSIELLSLKRTDDL